MISLANGLAARGHDVHVAVFYSGGQLERDLRGPVLHDLRKGGRWDVPPLLARLARLIRSLRPDAVHGYLGTANLFLALLRPALRRVPLVWGVRASNMDLSRYSALHRLHWRLEAFCSGLATRIIYNAEAGRAYAERCGFSNKRGTVIPNGIDTDRFVLDAEAGQRVRGEWAVGDDELLIGLPARLDPMKDHGTFLRAAALLAKTHGRARFACIGTGPDDAQRQLREALEQLGLGSRMAWFGPRQDMPAVYAALDLCCLSSAFGEGFPNVLGEAMACGTPCVATDVGDAGNIIGDLGLVVPPTDSDALAQALRAMDERLRQEGNALKNACRERIASKFGLERMVAGTEALLLGLVQQ